MSDVLTVSLTGLCDTHVAGRFLLPALRVTNAGDDARDVSRRLNLLEGDVAVLARRPDGQTTRHRGAVTLDSLPRRATLPPSHYIEAGLFASYTSAGVTFDTPGRYELAVEYVADGDTEVRSEWTALAIVDPGESTAELASVAGRESVCRAVGLYAVDEPSDSAVQALERLASDFSETSEGTLASLALAGRRDTVDAASPVFDRVDPLTTARYLTALTAPIPERHPLCRAFLDSLDDPETAPAAAVVRGSPMHTG